MNKSGFDTKVYDEVEGMPRPSWSNSLSNSLSRSKSRSISHSSGSVSSGRS